MRLCRRRDGADDASRVAAGDGAPEGDEHTLKENSGIEILDGASKGGRIDRVVWTVAYQVGPPPPSQAEPFSSKCKRVQFYLRTNVTSSGENSATRRATYWPSDCAYRAFSRLACTKIVIPAWSVPYPPLLLAAWFGRIFAFS